MSKDKVSSPRETEPKKKTLRGTIRPCTLLLHIKVSDQGHSAVKTAPSPPFTPPCYKNRTQQNTTVQAEPGTKSGSNKNKTETRDNIFAQFYKNCHGPQEGSQGTSKGRPRTRGVWRLRNSCGFWLAPFSGLCCRNGTGRVRGGHAGPLVPL